MTGRSSLLKVRWTHDGQCADSTDCSSLLLCSRLLDQVSWPQELHLILVPGWQGFHSPVLPEASVSPYDSCNEFIQDGGTSQEQPTRP